MKATPGESGRALFHLSLMTVAALALFAAPAAAQRAAAQRAAPGPQLANDDWRLLSELGFGYRITPQWRLRLDTQLSMTQQISQVRNLQLRPGLEYAFAANWAVVLGYVQNQHQPATLASSRGPFQDIAFGFDVGRLAVANRLRSEQLFYDNGTRVVRGRYRLSLEHPLGDTPFAVLVSDEVVFNLAVTGNHLGGYNRNHLYGGLVMEIGRGVRASAGYELISFTPRARLEQIHTLKLGLVFALN